MTNIAEILKDCPEGTKLYSLVHGECELVKVIPEQIDIIYHGIYEMSLDEYGRAFEHGECLLFPSKDNRDWSTFNKPKFKKGDFLKDEFGNIFICSEAYKTCWENEYLGVAFCVLFNNMMFSDKDWIWRSCLVSYATEEEKQKLLKVIGDNRYIWDSEKLELSEL